MRYLAVTVGNVRGEGRGNGGGNVRSTNDRVRGNDSVTVRRYLAVTVGNVRGNDSVTVTVTVDTFLVVEVKVEVMMAVTVDALTTQVMVAFKGPSVVHVLHLVACAPSEIPSVR